MKVYEIELSGWVQVGATITVEAASEEEARDEAMAEADSFTFPWDHRMYSEQAIDVQIIDVHEEKAPE